MEEFRDVLDEFGFRDLGFEREKFKWCNGQHDGFTVWERLDRAVVIMDWLEKFPTTKVVHMECGFLNHKPIFIYLNGIPKNRQKSWHFEHMWLEEEGCRDMIESTWLYDVPSHPMAWFEGKIS